MDRIKYKIIIFAKEIKNMFNNVIEHIFISKKSFFKKRIILRTKIIRRQIANKYFKKNKTQININRELVKDVFFTHKKINFIDTPFIYYVKQNIDKLLKNTFDFFNDYQVKIGIEIEFYCFNIENITSFKKQVKDFSIQNKIEIIDIISERGKDQYEVRFQPYINIYKLITDYNALKNYLITNFHADFSAKPIYYDVGSALQINLSINKNGQNLFAKILNKESDIFNNSVAGLIKFTNYFLPLYTKDKTCLKRYDEEFNNFVFINGKMPSPSYNAWGINNRTASLRIPTAQNFYDKEQYFIENNNNRRIEFRVPSANADIKLVLYGVLSSIKYGIQNNLQPQEQTVSNLLESNYNCERIKLEQITFAELLNINFEI